MEIKRRKDKLGPQPPTKRSSFIEWNYNAEIFAFGKRLNENFDENLLKNAFVNRSFILQEEVRQREAGVDNPEVNLVDNRKLIENGENFISKIVKEFLENNLPQFPEEGRNAVHDYLLSETVLSNISFHIGTKDIILSAVSVFTLLFIEKIIRAVCFYCTVYYTFQFYLSRFESFLPTSKPKMKKLTI